MWHVNVQTGTNHTVKQHYVRTENLKAKSHEKTILAKYVQNVTLINNSLINYNENIALK